MRDIAVTLLILGTIPLILRHAWIGVLVFAWVSIFNPHRFAFGFAYDFPFAMIIGVVTVSSMVLHWKEVRLPINSITVLLMLVLMGAPCRDGRRVCQTRRLVGLSNQIG